MPMTIQPKGKRRTKRRTYWCSEHGYCKVRHSTRRIMTTKGCKGWALIGPERPNKGEEVRYFELKKKKMQYDMAPI